ncbi:hypothetical protein [Rhodoferax mekongensis]|uniref:Uncharacterized protein n=1 Tax=Rhodoferax mekongensis TaxID=3068341 RepID=A0ABZ0AWI2_9BURK|nr:hypothetical protein [Rhodoferax sp. TBRC 17307]WNO04004.1 hypothetical protein RAN89_13940 [Rhodoferax sp. TBRC 17307]
MYVFHWRWVILLFISSLAGCAPSLHPGENYFPWSLLIRDNPDISINLHDNQWSIWVNGQDRTKDIGFSVKENNRLENVYFDIAIERPGDLPLLPEFRIQSVGGVKCTPCHERTGTWWHSYIEAKGP